jgi:acyl-CoA synthetase (AMP-forming)/AMP-acid ligase II
MQGEKVIGDYPDDWLPPEGCDLYDGLAGGSMVFVPSPAENEKTERAALLRARLASLEIAALRPLLDGEIERVTAINAQRKELREQLRAIA